MAAIVLAMTAVTALANALAQGFRISTKSDEAIGDTKAGC